MAYPAELTKLIDQVDTKLGEVAKLMKRAYELGAAGAAKAKQDGVAEGIAQERARLAKLLLDPAPAPADRSGQTRRPVTSNYGGIAAPVRETLRDLCRDKESVSINEVLEQAQRAGHPFDIGQVRTALKVLARSGVANRPVRGRYAVGPNMPPAPPSADKAGRLIVPTLPLTH